MMIHPLKIGNITLKNNIFCAPLAGYTDFSFRKLCYQFGAGLCFTEMVSAKGLVYGSEKTKELLYAEDYEKHTGVQIFGSDPTIMQRACESLELARFPIIDINMGCPVPKIYKNGEGSALLNNFPLVAKIIKACKKSGKIVTVKCRIGLEDEKLVASDFAKVCEDAGVDAITIHGRTRQNGHNGSVDFAQIAKAKQAVQIPVIANGGIYTREDAIDVFHRTNCDGIMLARGAMENPHIFAEILQDSPKNNWDKKAAILQQIEDMQKLYPERYVLIQMRKWIALYTKGMQNSGSYRKELFRCNALEDLLNSIHTIFH